MRPLVVAAGFLLALSASPMALAQEETIYIGGSAAQRNSVIVDMSVLDDHGAARGSQFRLPPPERGVTGQRVTLTPPSRKSVKPAPQRTATKQPAPRKPATSTAKAASPAKAAKPVAKAAAPKPTPPAPVMTEIVTPATVSEVPPPPEPIDIVMPEPVAAPMPKAVKAPAPTPAPAVAKSAPSAAAPRDLVPATLVAPAATPKEQPLETAPAPRNPPPEARPAAPPQMASLVPLPSSTQAARAAVRIPFAGEAAVLPESAKNDLKQIAGTLTKDQALRVQVMAYAGGGEDASKARRVSLSRALAVRTYLIEQGIGSTRIDVRALGNVAEGGPADRVDVVMLNR